MSLQNLVTQPDCALIPANTDNTNLTTVLTKSGAPGIYDSSTTDQNYGQYNCEWMARQTRPLADDRVQRALSPTHLSIRQESSPQMPHVRAQEYKKPSKEYQLEYVEVVQRHHKVGPVTKLKE